MKCILCGAELVEIYREPTIVVGYYCLICKDKDGNRLEWTLSEHKDNQNWAVRHIRALETQIKDLQEAVLILQQKVK